MFYLSFCVLFAADFPVLPTGNTVELSMFTTAFTLPYRSSSHF